MKKLLIVGIVLIFSTVLFPSCKKHYKCSCQDGTVVNSYLHKLNKSEANKEKEKCESTPGCEFLKD